MAQDIFIKIGSLKGESQDKQFKEWMDVLAWSWGATQTGSFHGGGGGGTGKVNVHDFSFTKRTDITSPKLVGKVCTGEHYDKVEVKARKAGGKPFVYLEYTFEDVIISSYSTGGSSADETISENISFNFAKFKIKYNQQSKTGAQDVDDSFTFNVQQNAEEG